MYSLNVNLRENSSGHSARRERKSGVIPGVLYGKGRSNLLVEVGEMELGREMSLSGEHGMIGFNLDGEEHEALLKEVQRDPVTHKVIHIDLEEIDKNRVIQSEVPIQFVGEEWLNRKGAVLQKEKDLVKVSCKASDLPKSIVFDVSKGGLGSVYRYSDLEIGSEISIVDDIKSVMASISNEKNIISDDIEDDKENKISEENSELK